MGCPKEYLNLTDHWTCSAPFTVYWAKRNSLFVLAHLSFHQFRREGENAKCSWNQFGCESLEAVPITKG